SQSKTAIGRGEASRTVALAMSRRAFPNVTSCQSRQFGQPLERFLTQSFSHKSLSIHIFPPSP
ncbi:MAG: hypothetical protein MUP41_05170, partial [Desulfobacterales bacterium]|nr:hypothetical protein [Desulfobacterales bacterium]